ncbi:MAG TPA: LysM peptidoglycan-binding domain-containing protein [Chloroflexota bacterium]|jgi:DNA-binding SARP family transcriptional activator/LysM repeat protein
MHADAVGLDEPRESRRDLGVLLVTLTALGAGLYTVAGGPHPPPSWPSWQTVLTTLRGSEPPLAAIGYILTTAAWLLWLWTVASLALRCAVVLAEALSHGAAWARALRRLSDRVTLPVVRRVVDGALVAVLVVHLVARTPAAAAAEPATPQAGVVVASPRADVAPAPASPVPPSADSRSVAYMVQPGDSLWRIAERYYGTGEEYKRLLTANVGRTMPDGARFDRTGVIRPSWVLVVPLPGASLEQTNGVTHYVVEEGDTLRGIAARFLGDEMRWPAIFELNRGSARLSDGRTLGDPDLIWPGLRLRLPAEASLQPASLMRAPDRDDPGLRRAAASATPAPTPPAPTPPAPTLPPPRPSLPSEPAPTPVAPAVVEEPAVTAVPPPAQRPVAAHDSASILLYGVGGAVGAAAAGGALYAARRRSRRGFDEAPIADEPAGDAVVHDGFAEAELARALAHRLHGGEAEPAVVVAGCALRYFAEHGLDLGVVTVRQGRRSIVLTLSARVTEHPRILALAPELGARLGATVRVAAAAENDVTIELIGLSRAGVLAPAADSDAEPPWLVPVGALSNREVLYVDWRELGHVLVAGLPGEGTETVLTSLVAALAARCRPAQLELWTIGHRRALPPEIGRLPHQRFGLVDPDDAEAVRGLIERARTELVRRMRATDRPDGPTPTIVLVVAELTDVSDDGLLDMLGEYGGAHGVRILAASTRLAMLGDGLLAHFTTRAVLRLEREEDSIRLLREPMADGLGAGGDMLLRVEARAPIHLRGFRVPPEHIGELVRLMADAYPVAGPAPAAGRAADPDGSADIVEMGEPAGSAPDAPDHDAGPAEGGPVVEAEDARVREPSPEAATVLDSVPAPTVTLNGHGGNGHGTSRHVAPHADTGAARASPGPNGTADLASPEPNGPLASTADPPLEVVCFGGPRVLHRGRPIWPPDRGRFKHWEVLVFLAAQPTGTVAREKLTEALWPGQDPRRDADPTRPLRSQLYLLRQAVAQEASEIPGDFVLLHRNGLCSLDPARVTSDVHRFVVLCEEARTLPPTEAKAAYRQALGLYRDDLLTRRHYEWLDERDDSGLTLSELYREMHRRATKELADLHLREGEAAAAIPLYRALLRAHPLAESLVRSLFRCYRLTGDRAALAREERHLRETLQQTASEGDLGRVEPEPKTSALFQRFLAELDARQETTARSASSAR